MLGIEKASQVSRYPLLGHMFENLVYSGDYFEFSDGITALKYDQVSEVFSEST